MNGRSVVVSLNFFELDEKNEQRMVKNSMVDTKRFATILANWCQLSNKTLRDYTGVCVV